MSEAPAGGAESYLLPITVIIPTLNEESNIQAAIGSVAWAERVIVVDSYSTDQTVSLARDLGAEVVPFRRTSDKALKKKNWALTKLPISSDWTMILDADERVPSALADLLPNLIGNRSVDAYALDREFIFMGKSLRCFRPNWNIRLFRTGHALYEDLGLHSLPATGDNEIHEHMVVKGKVAFVPGAALLHEDYRNITAWVDRHNKYATWEAHFYVALREQPIPSALAILRADPISRKRMLRRVWAQLPLRPLLRFLVWYVFRGGFRDGRIGLIFCTLMAWYEQLIVIKISELDSAAPTSVTRAAVKLSEAENAR